MYTSAHGRTARRTDVIALMAGLRVTCSERSRNRAHHYASRLADALSNLRGAEDAAPASPALVSVALDEFVGEIRTSVELARTNDEQTLSAAQRHEADRVYQPLATLCSMYARAQADLRSRAIAPAAFMAGAEGVAATALRELDHLANAPRQRAARHAAGESYARIGDDDMGEMRAHRELAA
jgi:hypothetical protein